MVPDRDVRTERDSVGELVGVREDRGDPEDVRVIFDDPVEVVLSE